jgi:long-chain fatty acid transport protein
VSLKISLQEGGRMKKALITLVLALFIMPFAFGTLVTNTNQSAMYIRMLARNASTDIDAVYYNPAGLTMLTDGFHLAIHNQTISQEKTIVNSFPLLIDDEYVGETKVPFFPTVFAVYKMDKLAISFGFGPNAGGGTADYSNGLPSFGIPISQIPAMLTMMGLPTTKYSADIEFNGSSIYYGFQFNLSYAFNEMFSAAAGIRYISAVNEYEGTIRNIMINPYHPLANPTANMLPASQFFSLIGQPGLAAMTSDQCVNAKQKGSAITPILGLNIKPTENLNIGVTYEFNTNLEFENETTVDDTGMFPDGYKFRNDIPAIFSLGAEYSVTPKLRAMLSYHMFFDRSANWEGAEDLVDNNSYDIAFGFEYDINEAFLISAGYLYTKVDLSDEYLNDMNFELPSNTFGFGAQYTFNQKFTIDAALITVSYSEDSKTINYGAPFGSFTETYKKTTFGFSIGLGYHF